MRRWALLSNANGRTPAVRKVVALAFEAFRGQLDAAASPNEQLLRCLRRPGLRRCGGCRETWELSPQHARPVPGFCSGSPAGFPQCAWAGHRTRLLTDAFERVLKASEQIGVRGIVVHAAPEAARTFDLLMRFDPSPSDPSVSRVNPTARSLFSAAQ